MTRSLHSLLALSCLVVYGFATIGCGTNTTPPPAAESEHADHDHDHDHDDHDHEHDHPAHGEHGGHMVALNDGSEVEVAFDDDTDTFTVYPAKPETITKVEMVTTIEGTPTTYEFEKNDTFDSAIFGLKSPELSTAAKVGEGVDIQLVITTEEGERTGKYVHHQH